MFRSDIQESDLLNHEDIIDKYYHDNDTDWNTKIKKAKEIVFGILRSSGIETRKITVPFYLSLNSISSKEPIERSRLMLLKNSNSFPDDFILKLYGRMSTGDQNINVGELLIPADSDETEFSFTFSTPYYYYYAELYSGTTLVDDSSFTIAETESNLVKSITITQGDYSLSFSLFLIERTFDLAVIYCALDLIFRSLIEDNGDIYEGKADFYRSEYLDILNRIQIPIDTNLDGKIDTESEIGSKIIKWTR